VSVPVSVPAPGTGTAPGRRGEAPWRGRLRRFGRHRPAVASLIFLIALSAVAAAAPWIGAALGLDARAMDLGAMTAPPSTAHPLGTDQLGRDLLMRILLRARVSLIVALATAALAGVIGTAIGLMAGYFGGRADQLLMRITDGVIALPLLPLLIVLAAIDPARLGVPEDLARGEQAALGRIVILIALVGWTQVARLVRASALAARAQLHVTAAKALGAGHGRIMAVHILPGIASPIIVATTLSVGTIILLESVLSFLGLGIPPATPSWGNMLTGAQDHLQSAPHLAIFPGLAILLTVIAFNFLGDGLQDALDPRA